jgi:hypothetical protein
VATAINNFLICFEMFLLSIANIWVYSYDEYRPEKRKEEGIGERAKNVFTRLTKDVVNQKDMIHDTRVILSHEHYKVVKEKSKATRGVRPFLLIH